MRKRQRPDCKAVEQGEHEDDTTEAGTEHADDEGGKSRPRHDAAQGLTQFVQK